MKSAADVLLDQVMEVVGVLEGAQVTHFPFRTCLPSGNMLRLLRSVPPEALQTVANRLHEAARTTGKPAYVACEGWKVETADRVRWVYVGIDTVSVTDGGIVVTPR